VRQTDRQLHPKTPSKQDIDIERTNTVTVITGQEELGAKLEEEQKAQNEWRGKTTKKAKRERRECRTINSTKHRT
jgi:hypothetical protein